MLNKLEQSAMLDEVIINTDSDEVIDFVASLKGKTRAIRRPEFLLGHHVTANSIIEYDMSQTDSEHFFQTHCTNPLLSVKTIDQAINLYFKNLPQFDSVYSVDRMQKRAFLSDSTPINHSYDILLPTQQLEPVLIENSNLFIFSKASFVANKKYRIGKRPLQFEMNYIESLDIDNEEDFNIAELVYQNLDKFSMVFG